MSRRNSVSRIPNIGQRKNIFLLVDGECEYDYLKAFKRHEKYIQTLRNIDIEPDLPKFKSSSDKESQMFSFLFPLFSLGSISRNSKLL